MAESWERKVLRKGLLILILFFPSVHSLGALLQLENAVELTTLETRIIQTVCDQFGAIPNTVTRETKLDEGLGADSLDMAELKYDLEEEFEIAIADQNWGRVTTIGEVIDCIRPLGPR